VDTSKFLALGLMIAASAVVLGVGYFILVGFLAGVHYIESLPIR
jgi:hypothetical protein